VSDTYIHQPTHSPRNKECLTRTFLHVASRATASSNISMHERQRYRAGSERREIEKRGLGACAPCLIRSLLLFICCCRDSSRALRTIAGSPRIYFGAARADSMELTKIVAK
jgi:hypothetical protein